MARSGVIAAGSTSVQPFAEVLAEDYMRLHPGMNVDVQGGGSAAGIMAASSGTAQIGMSSRDLTGDETRLWHVEIARDGLALIVNPKNPVDKLSVNQVRAIYDRQHDKLERSGRTQPSNTRGHPRGWVRNTGGFRVDGHGNDAHND